jgi:hypothetical protein
MTKTQSSFIEGTNVKREHDTLAWMTNFNSSIASYPMGTRGFLTGGKAAGA